jgi:phosphate transport system substrate-binding protein
VKPGFASSRGWLALSVATVVAIAPAMTWSRGAAAGDSQDRPLVLAGCGSNAPITLLLVELFTREHPGTRFDVRVVGSTNGIWLAAAGVISLGLVSRPLTDAERALGLETRPYARTPLVIAAHPAVGDVDITTDELVATYAGERVRWRSGGRIRLFSREVGDSTVVLLSRQLPGFRAAYLASRRSGRAMVTYSEEAMVEALSRHPYSLGFTDLGTLTIERPFLTVLRVNGTLPTLEAVEDGRYPLVKTLSFSYRRAGMPATIEKFLDFVGSLAGERVLRTHGYLPG